ncbi:tetratricopeptide repeat protein [Mangrovimonas xylaniphaga]|uniref:tetratricopeptide repeat protein n=1 Tax=Mangrovimonas xylaniphaga TaxID=1645915 RepID=UPI0006B5DCDC|nr:tetratricopeptide repeat protein [Mangrovimonas xylaniphaga]
MKARITLVLVALFLSVNIGFAQQDEECMTNLMIFSDYVKSKKYDEAYEPWMKVRNKCPKFNYAIYGYGEKILDHKIKNSSGADKAAFVNDKMKLLDEGLANFPNKYEKGEVLNDKGLLMYDNKKELGVSNQEIYDMFDRAYKEDLKNFKNPKGLYVYFSTAVDLYNEGKLPLQSVFDKYDDVSDKIGTEVEICTEELNKLVQKEEAGQTLTSKEEKYRKYYTNYLENYEKIGGSIDSKLGQLANCENLIPLYKKDFETYKNDAVWLKRAVSRMYNKECTDDPLYIELVKAYDATAPSADTKYFVATILFKQNKDSEAVNYLKQAFDLETDKYKKGRLAERIGGILKKKGRYSEARNYYRESLKLNPSNGRPHLNIAAMYAASANDCGADSFDKRAVFWYAAQEARKAGKVDATLTKVANQTAASYEGNAPTKGDIFTKGNAGQTIKIGCWINGSVVVPSL